jgi:hypothetical protein
MTASYKDFPPLKYFLRVLKNCPKSAFFYVQLWERKYKMSLKVSRDEIRKNFLISPTLFRSLLSPLAYMNIINFREHDNLYHIEICGNQDD